MGEKLTSSKERIFRITGGGPHRTPFVSRMVKENDSARIVMHYFRPQLKASAVGAVSTQQMREKGELCLAVDSGELGRARGMQHAMRQLMGERSVAMTFYFLY